MLQNIEYKSIGGLTLAVEVVGGRHSSECFEGCEHKIQRGRTRRKFDPLGDTVPVRWRDYGLDSVSSRRYFIWAAATS